MIVAGGGPAVARPRCAGGSRTSGPDGSPRRRPAVDGARRAAPSGPADVARRPAAGATGDGSPVAIASRPAPQPPRRASPRWCRTYRRGRRGVARRPAGVPCHPARVDRDDGICRRVVAGPARLVAGRRVPLAVDLADGQRAGPHRAGRACGDVTLHAPADLRRPRRPGSVAPRAAPRRGGRRCRPHPPLRRRPSDPSTTGPRRAESTVRRAEVAGAGPSGRGGNAGDGSTDAPPRPPGGGGGAPAAVTSGPRPCRRRCAGASGVPCWWRGPGWNDDGAVPSGRFAGGHGVPCRRAVRDADRECAVRSGQSGRGAASARPCDGPADGSPGVPSAPAVRPGVRRRVADAPTEDGPARVASTLRVSLPRRQRRLDLPMCPDSATLGRPVTGGDRRRRADERVTSLPMWPGMRATSGMSGAGGAAGACRRALGRPPGDVARRASTNETSAPGGLGGAAGRPGDLARDLSTVAPGPSSLADGRPVGSAPRPGAVAGRRGPVRAACRARPSPAVPRRRHPAQRRRALARARRRSAAPTPPAARPRAERRRGREMRPRSPPVVRRAASERPGSTGRVAGPVRRAAGRNPDTGASAASAVVVQRTEQSPSVASARRRSEHAGDGRPAAVVARRPGPASTGLPGPSSAGAPTAPPSDVIRRGIAGPGPAGWFRPGCGARRFGAGVIRELPARPDPRPGSAAAGVGAAPSGRTGSASSASGSGSAGPAGARIGQNWLGFARRPVVGSAASGGSGSAFAPAPVRRRPGRRRSPGDPRDVGRFWLGLAVLASGSAGSAGAATSGGSGSASGRGIRAGEFGRRREHRAAPARPSVLAPVRRASVGRFDRIGGVGRFRVGGFAGAASSAGLGVGPDGCLVRRSGESRRSPPRRATARPDRSAAPRSARRRVGCARLGSGRRMRAGPPRWARRCGRVGGGLERRSSGRAAQRRRRGRRSGRPSRRRPVGDPFADQPAARGAAPAARRALAAVVGAEPPPLGGRPRPAFRRPERRADRPRRGPPVAGTSVGRRAPRWARRSPVERVGAALGSPRPRAPAVRAERGRIGRRVGPPAGAAPTTPSAALAASSRARAVRASAAGGRRPGATSTLSRPPGARCRRRPRAPTGRRCGCRSASSRPSPRRAHRPRPHAAPTRRRRRRDASPRRREPPTARGATPSGARRATPVVATVALPARFRPLTTAIVARRVRLAHGRPVALPRCAAVGRPAATLGNVVHLAAAPDCVGGHEPSCSPTSWCTRRTCRPARASSPSPVTTPRSTTATRSAGWPGRPAPDRGAGGDRPPRQRRRRHAPRRPARRDAGAEHRAPAPSPAMPASAGARSSAARWSPSADPSRRSPRGDRGHRDDADDQRHERRSNDMDELIRLLEQRVLQRAGAAWRPSRGGW